MQLPKSNIPTTPLVSILVPCYNAAPWLNETLESALAQTYQNTEILLVDDGSTDSSLSIARSFEPRGVRVFTQLNSGAAAARNHALRHAQGDFIQYLDADDLLAPEKISQQLLRLYQDNKKAVLTGCWGRFSESIANTVFHSTNPLFHDLSPTRYLCAYASEDCMMHPAAWLIPRDVVQAAGTWNEKLSLNDDGEYFTRIVLQAERVLYCPNALSYYRSGLNQSLSNQRSSRHLESAYLALQLIVEHLRNYQNDPLTRQAAADLCQRFAYDYYPARPDLVNQALQQGKKLGGSKLRPLGGSSFHFVSHLLGWKMARWLQARTGKFPHASEVLIN